MPTLQGDYGSRRSYHRPIARLERYTGSGGDNGSNRPRVRHNDPYGPSGGATAGSIGGGNGFLEVEGMALRGMRFISRTDGTVKINA